MAEDITEAGRGLNRAIAERVLGWRMYQYDKDVAANCYWMLLTADNEPAVFEAPFRQMEKPSEEAAWAVCPNFSGDISAFFSHVVPAMHARGLLLALAQHSPREWWVEFATADYKRGGQSIAETLPAAGCGAALEAIASEVP